MKCFWCGKKNKNVEISQTGKMVRVLPCEDCASGPEKGSSVLCNMTQEHWQEITKPAEIVPWESNKFRRKWNTGVQ